MSAIKKAYQPIVDLLNANQGKKVSEILAQVTELASAKTARAVGYASLKDAEGKTVAILDYYFKRWMPLVGDKKVDVGAKQGTATGYNTMSKAGVSEWTKQNRIAKQAREQLLKDVGAGTVKHTDLNAKLAEIDAASKVIVPTELGFATEAEVRKYLEANKVKLAA